MHETTFLRVLEADDKSAALLAAIREPQAATGQQRFEVNPERFGNVPGSPFAYWLPNRLLALLDQESRVADVFVCTKGLSTDDDFRFVRLWWEVHPESLGHEAEWAWFAKGGPYALFHYELHLVVLWALDGKEIAARAENLGANVARTRQSSRFYFKPATAFTRRTTLPLSARILPPGCAFSDKTVVCSPRVATRADTLALAALLNSGVVGRLIAAVNPAADAAARSYESGSIGQLPLLLDGDARAHLAAAALSGWHAMARSRRTQEQSVRFTQPQDPLADTAEGALRAALDSIDREVSTHCGLHEAIASEHHTLSQRQPGSDEDESVEVPMAPPLASLLSWSEGVALGRFDVRLATGDREPPPEPDPFDPLPIYSPGMFPDGQIPDDYPLTVDADGILVEDQGYPDDLLAEVREVLTLLWPDNPEAIEAEACKLLGLDSLRDWFRNAANFWDDHLKRYSKSRRKAPIYWMLSGQSGSVRGRDRTYSVWIYYHQFDRDTLYKVLNQYVKPKLEHELRGLDTLRAEAGPEPTASQRKAIETQETFCDELRGFRDEVARVAPLWNPDLNDGVILNHAPLWRLVPHHKAWQRECKACWDKLVAGDYDWAHLAMHLWPERVVPKCAEDRSLAIAHDLEHEFWLENAEGKWDPRDVPPERVEELIAERTIKAVQEARDELVTLAKQDDGGKRRRR